MNQFIDELLEEAIMALKLAGAMIPQYTVLEDGSVYFKFGRQEEGDPTVHSDEPRDTIG